MHAFTPRLEILPASQRRLWNELTDVPPEFTLYGGTAIALRLGHRESVDFDFFGDAGFDTEELLQTVSFLQGCQVTQKSTNTLSVVVDRGSPVQVSFFGVPKIGKIEKADVLSTIGLKVASLIDLAGMKAAVVQRRAEAKDYVDIDALIQQGLNLATALSAAGHIYGKTFNPQITLKALSCFGEGNLETVAQDTKSRLRAAIRSVDLDRLPDLNPYKPRPKSLGD